MTLFCRTLPLILGLVSALASAQGQKTHVVPPVTLDRLARMSPDEREKALATVPPERRANIEKRLADFGNLPPAQQERVISRLTKLNSLPQARRREVRQSMRDFSALPQGRKTALNQEMRRMDGMPADERQAYTGTDGFRRRFSTDERRIMDDLSAIMPDRKQN